jgi:hypothetical protein
LYELALYEETEQVIHAAIETFSLDQLHHCIVGMGHLYRDRGDYEHVDICSCKHRNAELDPDWRGFKNCMRDGRYRENARFIEDLGMG